MSAPGKPFLSENAYRRELLARIQKQTTNKPQWISNESNEVERVRQNKRIKANRERDAAIKKKSLHESIRIANRLQREENNIAMKKLERYEKIQTAALKARYNAENEAEYARQNELNRERNADLKKRIQNAARNETLRNASSRTNRARIESLDAAWWASQAVRPATATHLARRNDPLPVDGELIFYKKKFLEQSERLELVRLVFFQLKDQFKILQLDILPRLTDTPPLLKQPTYMLNNALRKKWMRRKQNVFVQKRANGENARMAKFSIVRSEAARANLNALSKQLVVARRSRALPRDVVTAIASMERINQGIQKSRTPQQQRAAMHKIAPFIRAASHLAPIFGVALGLAGEFFVVKTRATTIASIFASHSRLEVMRMILMLMMTIAPLLIFMLIKKSGGVR